MITKFNKILKEEKIFCPHCLDPLKISLNSLKISNGYNCLMKNNELTEFSKISCKKCYLDFTFVLCAYCNKKIYMKMYQKNVPYNGLNAHNIICPYALCNQVFYFTKCPKCQLVQKQKTFIKEGSVVFCMNKQCNFKYIQVNCPINYCTDLISFERPKIYTNFPMGIMLLHKNEIMYQKINCYYCYRPIVYQSKKNHKNKYCEGQKVICPYKDCKKTFNRIVCPQCFDEIYINDGWYEMGSKINCKCGKVFGKILCPSCGKMNTCENNFFKMGQMKCGFHNCAKESNMINCLFCRKLNIFENTKLITGQVIKCGYCSNTFNEIFCPFCKKINPFPLADFSFGKVYKCKYLTCMKEFQFLICPKCNIHSFIKEKQEGQRLKCESCQTLFMNWGCPFCKSNIMDKNTSLQIGQLIKCPSEKCQKIYSFIRCSACHKLIFSKANESICGKAVKCPYQNCKASTLVTYCPICNVKTIYNGKKPSLNEGESVHCENCKQNYIFQKNKLIYNGDLKILDQIEGKTIDFGVGEVDENYLGIQDLFFTDIKADLPTQFISEQSEKITKDENKIITTAKLKECIVCHNNIRESVFVPCGHRCVCYNCAVIIFAVHKKCPECNEVAKCIIKKVYD